MQCSILNHEDKGEEDIFCNSEYFKEMNLYFCFEFFPFQKLQQVLVIILGKYLVEFIFVSINGKEVGGNELAPLVLDVKEEIDLIPE